MTSKCGSKDNINHTPKGGKVGAKDLPFLLSGFLALSNEQKHTATKRYTIETQDLVENLEDEWPFLYHFMSGQWAPTPHHTGAVLQSILRSLL